MNEQHKQTQTNFVDPLGKVRGEFTLKVYKGDNLVEDYQDHNVVVNLGRNALAKFLGGEGQGAGITQIGFGTDGAQAMETNTVLADMVAKAIGAKSYPSTNSIKWVWTLEAAECVGMAIREFGLLLPDDTLFARRSRQVIEKTADMRLEGTWAIYF